MFTKEKDTYKQSIETMEEYQKARMKETKFSNVCNIGFSFMLNDAYVYIVAHAYKHFIFSGTEIRTLIDLYVFNEHCKDQLDRNYIHEQCTVLGIQEYEEKARTIAYKLFDQPVQDFSFLTQEENEYIGYYFSSGTYGTTRQRIRNSIHKLELEGSRHAKAKYIFQRLFPSVSWFREHNKFLDAYPFLIPFYAIIRLVTKPFTSWSKWTMEMKDVKESK